MKRLSMIIAGLLFASATFAADLTITGTGVAPVVTGTRPTFANKVVQLGANCTGGQLLYLKSDGKWYLAIATGTAEQAGKAGLMVAASAGNSGQWVVAVGPGAITIGTGSIGVLYAVSPHNAGGIAPYADLASGNQVNIVGQVTATGVLTLNPQFGTALP